MSVVERLDVDASRRRCDRDVAAADRPMEHAVDEAVREIDPEDVEAPRREREVVRLGEREERQKCEVTPAGSSSDVGPSADGSSAHENM